MIAIKIFSKKYKNFVLAISIGLMTFAPAEAQAAVVSFNCPSGGGTYQVDSGTVTGTTGTCTGDLTLDSSVITIDTYAFAYNQLTSLTIPATTTTINGSPFGNVGASELTSITVDNANPNYASVNGVLFDKNLTELIVYPSNKSGTSYTIPSTVTSIRYYGFSANKNLTSINIPNTVTTLGGQLFYLASAITSVTIGSGVTTIGDQSFSYIKTLTSINVDIANANFASVNGVLYDKNISTLWAYPIGKSDTTYTAPNTVTSTKYTVFGGAENLLTVDLSSVATLSGQEFMDATSVQEIKFGNSLTNLKSQVLQSTTGLKKLTLGTGLTTIDSGAFYNNTKLYCVIYPGSDSTIQNFAFPNGVVPVSSASSCLADPAFTISSASESVVKGAALSGYTITSTGGAIASYSISPAISNTPGLTFSTSTGLISGTPTTIAAARTYTITATNAANTATQTFSITVIAPPPPPPVPMPFLTTVSTPQIHLQDNKLVCTAGTYKAGYEINGIPQGDQSKLFTPGNYIFNLFIDGIKQISEQKSSPSSKVTWDMPKLVSGALISCSVTVTANTVSNTDKSTDNSAAVASAKLAQLKEISTSESIYQSATSSNSKTYQKALIDNRINWRAQVEKVRAGYFTELARISTLPAGKSTTALKSAALKSYIAATKKAAVDYRASQPAAAAVRDLANQAALDAKNAAVTRANTTFGAFIESIGHGVLIP